MSLIVTVKTLAFSPVAVVISPLKKPVPLFKGVHGDANEDCATECVGGKKTNST